MIEYRPVAHGGALKRVLVDLERPADPPGHPGWLWKVGRALWWAVTAMRPDIEVRVQLVIMPSGDYGTYTSIDDTIRLDRYAACPSVLIHELAHWTGHPTRLARSTIRDYHVSETERQQEEALAMDVTDVLCRRWAVDAFAGRHQIGADIERIYGFRYPPSDPIAVEDALTALEPIVRAVDREIDTSPQIMMAPSLKRLYHQGDER